MTEPALQTKQAPDIESCWALLERVSASTQLKRAPRLRELLLFLGNCSLKDGRDQVHEQEIGTQVFGRRESYDTSIDNIVRTNVSDLRKRIDAYFQTDGSQEPVLMEIPRGSYIPVFKFRQVEATDSTGTASPRREPDGAEVDPQARPAAEDGPGKQMSRLRRVALWTAASLLLAGLIAGIAWKVRIDRRDAALNDFWRPILHDKGTILLCAGGNTYAQNPVPGFFTADRETDYPYFSLQTEISTTLLSTLIERNGATPQFVFAASTPLPELHEHPIILLNAYNNQWTLRLVEGLRFHFSPEPSENDHSIVDGTPVRRRWIRDHSIPYSSADDYALVARFRDPTTDNWVVVLAGLGRNGTEAATRFVVDPHYMQTLRDQMGASLGNRNIEAVLKVRVIDGKTGAPSILAVHTW